MHEHEAPIGRRHSASSSSNTSGSPRPSGSKLDPDSGSGRSSSRRAAGRGGGRSGRGSPLASSSQHAASAAAALAVHSAVDAVAVAERLSPRATASAAATVYVPPAHAPADRPQPQPRQPPRASLQWARMKNAIEPVKQFMQMIVKNARDPVAVGDALLWLVLLPLEAMRRTARNPGAMALLRVTLEATAELLVAAMLAGAAICVTALHVMTEQEEGADGDSDKRSEPAQRLLPCCYPLQHESPLPVDAGGERCSPRPALSSPLPTSLH